jgi:hypothetical protein
VSPVEIVSLRNPKTLDFQEVYRPNHCIHRILVMEILIKFATTTAIFLGTCFERNTPLHVVEARSFGGR